MEYDDEAETPANYAFLVTNLPKDMPPDELNEAMLKYLEDIAINECSKGKGEIGRIYHD